MTRKELVKQKYPEQFNKALSIADYSNGKNKYLIWIAKQLDAGHNESDISATLKFFHNNIERFEEKNIGKYKDLKDLENLVKDMGLSKRKERESKKSASEKIYEDDHSVVIRVDDKEAMIYYGANTKWCTTMKHQTYYEDYVSRGNEFYIIIRKDWESQKSSKYAVVRSGLLDFEIFDTEDNLSRSFSDKESNLLRKPVQAIVADNPPKNFLWKICNKKVSISESSAWLKTQSEITQGFVHSHVPELQFANKSINQIIDYIFESEYRIGSRFDLVVNSLKDENFIAKIANELTKQKYNNNNYYPFKQKVIKNLNNKDYLIFKKDKDARVRATVSSLVGPEDASQFFTDRSTLVVKNAAINASISDILEFIEKSKSVNKKKIIYSVLLKRISNNKLIDLIIKQPRDEIIKMAS